MNKVICKYSIIRFQPYTETGEFANIGIVLYVQDLQRFVYKLLSAKQHERITHFFKPMTKSLFSNTVRIIQAELKRLQNLSSLSPARNVDLYNELIRPREDIIRYSENRVLFSSEPEKKVVELFQYYVQRNFTQHNEHENQMNERVRALLQENHLAEQFKRHYVGDKKKYGLYFPFVSTNAHQTIIKPIQFRQRGSNELINYGLVWLGKMNQLMRYGYIQPEDTLLAYQAPDSQKGELFEAFEDIRTQIEDTGIVTADIKKPQQIMTFALSRIPQLPLR